MPILESGLRRQDVLLLRALRSVPRTGRSERIREGARLLFSASRAQQDDTCAAVVTSSRQILSNVVVKQHDLHEGFGGIHPSVAIEAHQRNMPGAVRMALEQAHISIHDVDGIAFTRGPGIGGCLSVGSNAAKSLAAALGKPLVGVHHMQAHALTPLLTTPTADLPKFPFLTLLISGGHTLLLLASSPTSFQILATTADASIGRAFDKAARALGLSWGTRGPGAALEELCRMTNDELESLPDIPPFTTATFLSVDEPLSSSHKIALARAFQTAAARQLCAKLTLSLQNLELKGVNVRDVVVSGGVASNIFLRERLRAALDEYSSDERISLHFPPLELCTGQRFDVSTDSQGLKIIDTDNAAMIAWASMHRFLAGDYDDYTIDLRPKWSIEDIRV
ncbi:glycoprotease family-domain-containing protein [Suillus subaureus]|uniref:N(6)-L-threonylcarbamoyladenine synthase n=1 Tax=Suillus subaureus TaxID=48587 RepID=A0A9P7DU83_9AGAM|nr:glycoprotease family-domain-containing protein [Suillus subaureus]KAG1803401.1 glycoprotease family-domain-containing protein [Suillus subaureus]